MNYSFLRNIGGREEQQDSVGIFQVKNKTFMIVADGMGGHKGGSLASSTLLNIAENDFLFNNNSISNPKKFFNTIIEKTQEELKAFSQGKSIDPCTTVVFALIIDYTLYYAYIGDSRLYLFEKSKRLIFRTRDHSLPEMLFQDNQINEEEIPTHPKQNVLTKYIGIDSIDKAEYGIIKLNRYKEYRILLASDGLWAMQKEDELYHELFSENNIKVSTRKLLNVSKYRGGKDGDNISLATLSLKENNNSLRSYFLAFLLPLSLIIIYTFWFL